MNQHNDQLGDTPDLSARVATNFSDRISAGLVERAARVAPGLLSQRLEEEWLADLATRRTAVSRLSFAIGCCWATRVIAWEHRGVSVPAYAGSAEARSLVGILPWNLALLSRRTTALLFVVLLHVGVFFALVAGLADRFTIASPTPFTVSQLPDVHPQKVPVVPPPQQFKPLLLPVPLPEYSVVQPFQGDEMIGEVLDRPAEPAVAEVPAAPHVVQQVKGGPGVGFPNPDDFYPSLSRHLAEQGATTVQVCVDTHGRLTAEPTTVQSTGSSRLDEAALTLAKAGSGHYRATTEDGHPVNSCYPFRIRFQLKN